MIDFKNSNLSAKDKALVERFYRDGFWGGRVYKNAKGEERFVTFINYPVGVMVTEFHACSEDGLKISYEGGDCNVEEWYKWLGDSWQDGEPLPKEETAVDKVAKAKAGEYASGALTTKPFETKEGGRKWVSHNGRKKS